MKMRSVLVGIGILLTSFLGIPAAMSEPGEGGISTAEACQFYLKYYRDGDPPSSRPCDQENYKMITQELECSPAVRRQAEAIRERCGGPPAAQKAEPARCVQPPAGTVKSLGPAWVCVYATNTNSDARCVYSFTYLHSKSGRLVGGSVQPGKTEERCTQQPGTTVQFEKWTLVGGAAR